MDVQKRFKISSHWLINDIAVVVLLIPLYSEINSRFNIELKAIKYIILIVVYSFMLPINKTKESAHT